MKEHFNAKIVGYELFVPDKDSPKDEAVRVKLAINSELPLGKALKGAIPIEKKHLANYPIGTYLRITIQDSQQELSLEREDHEGDSAEQGAMEMGEGKAGGRRRPSAPAH